MSCFYWLVFYAFQDVGLVISASVFDTGDPGSIPGRVKLKTFKISTFGSQLMHGIMCSERRRSDGTLKTEAPCCSLSVVDGT